MPDGMIVSDDEGLRNILKNARTIAVLGLSPKPERDSNRVARYLKDRGYRIIPVRPGQKELLDEPAFASISEISEPVDIVTVFRRSDQILPHIGEALSLRPKVFWMQLGIENAAAAQELTGAGINVVMDRCIKQEHERLNP